MKKDFGTIFDMDGVLVDSEPLWTRAELEIFGEAGLPVTAADTVQTRGLRITEVVDYWYRRWPEKVSTPAQELTSAVIRRMVELLNEEAEPCRGAIEAVRAASQTSIVGLATSSPPPIIDAVLDRLGLRNHLAAVSSGENEPFGKPHPAVYLTTAAKIGIPPTDCVAIEDSVHGVVSAKAARMICIAVPEPSQRRDPRFGIADLVLDSLEELSADLLSKLCRR
ncbi:MAG: hexitol phosphatase HxpB [Deltaproteobacteria bacterium]|nr:hexitol phosphatase HxpB [Deltaproteobacteria bacterium]